MGTGSETRHLNLARQLLYEENVREFNALRDEYPDLPIVLHEENLRGLRLPRINLAGVRLVLVDFGEADLTGASFDTSTLEGVVFNEAQLEQSSFVGAKIGPATITYLRDGQPANRLITSDFKRANLSGADLRHARLSKACLTSAILHKAQLQHVILDDCDLTEVTVREANGTYASISRNRATNADFSTEKATSERFQAFNIFGQRLFADGDQFTSSALSHRALTWPEGLVTNIDPRTTERHTKGTKAMKSTDEGFLGRARQTAGSVLQQVRGSVFSDRVREGLEHAGGELALRVGRKGVMAAAKKLLNLDEANTARLEEFLNTDAGTALVCVFLRVGMLLPVPANFKPYADILEKQLEVKAISAGVLASGGVAIEIFQGPMMEILNGMESAAKQFTEVEEKLRPLVSVTDAHPVER